MFQTSKIFGKLKGLAAGSPADKPESAPAKQADPQIARINALLDIAEKANANIPKNSSEGSFEALKAEFGSLKKDLLDIVNLIESRNNSEIPVRNAAADSEIQKMMPEEIRAIKKDIEMLKADNAKTREIARDSKTMPFGAMPHDEIGPKISGLAKKVSDLSREMSLGRSAYSENIRKLENEIEGMKKTAAEKNAGFGKKTKEIIGGLADEIALIKSAKKMHGVAHETDIGSLLLANAALEKKCGAMAEEISEMRRHALELETSVESIKSGIAKKESVLPHAYRPESRARLQSEIGENNEATEKMLKRLDDLKESLNT